MVMTMSVVRIHRYRVPAGDLDEFLARRAALIEGVRRAYPGLIATRLTRLEDETYTDAWHWKTMQDMVAALPAAGSAEAAAAMSLTKDASAGNGEVVDERVFG
jgi:Antibiotic biosynthesis monooxygenase